MLQDQVLAMLRQAGAPLSGEAMSGRLGVSRAAVWKAVNALRTKGYQIEGQAARGYRLLESPDVLTVGELEDPERIIGGKVLYLSTVDSTSYECRRRAMEDAPDGLAVIADEQTKGQGRRGRSFQSLAGKGLYLSVLMRPRVELALVSQITAWTAVAVAAALERTTGLAAEIKWPNDILLDGKKLCGILTELGVEGENGGVSYVIVGIGVNMGQTREDFGPELAPIATSLLQHGVQIRRADLAAALLEELDRMCRDFPMESARYLEAYRARCVNLGREVLLLRPAGDIPATALDVEADFSLRVRLADGREERVTAGEVSLRDA